MPPSPARVHAGLAPRASADAQAQQLEEAIARGELPKAHSRKRGREAAGASGGAEAAGGAKRGGRRVCSYFGSARGCRHGARCKFAHTQPDGAEHAAAQPPAAAPAAATAAAPVVPAPAPACGGLAGLIAAYGEASGSDEEEGDDQQQQTAGGGEHAPAAAMAADGSTGERAGTPDEARDEHALTAANAVSGTVAGASTVARVRESEQHAQDDVQAQAGAAATQQPDSAQPAVRPHDTNAQPAEGDGAPGEGQRGRVSHHAAAQAAVSGSGGRGGSRVGSRGARTPASAQAKAPTLLQKLLSKEIRAEKSLILQCIRHITTHNFLHAADRQ